MNRLLLVEPEPLTRRGLVAVIEGEPDLTVYADVGNGADALAALRDGDPPDLAIVELVLPDQSGLRLIETLHRRHPDLPILATAAPAEALCVERALKAGARGYFVRHEALDVLLGAARRVLDGGYAVSNEVLDELLAALACSRQPLIPLPQDVLSPREMELFNLLADGLTTLELADRMSVSHGTIESYRNRIKEKLNITSTHALLRQALRWTGANRVCYLMGCDAATSPGGGEAA